jgi:hypothetical protein
MTSSGTRNPPKKGISPGITSLFGFRPVRSKLVKNPSNGNNSRIGSSKSYILTIPIFSKLKYEDLFKMKNKPDPALLGTSYFYPNK